MQEQWLSIVEYARQNNVSDMTVRRRIKTGKIKATLKDGKYYIPLASDSTELSPVRPQSAPVVKSRPVMTSESPYGVKPYVAPEPQQRQGFVPQNLSEGFDGAKTASVNANALLAYCEATLKKYTELERRQVERFKSKLDAVEARLELKEKEVESLKQQLEDAQLLIRMLESRLDG